MIPYIYAGECLVDRPEHFQPSVPPSSQANLRKFFFKKLYKMTSKTVFCYFAYDDQAPSAGLLEVNKERNESVFASLNAAGWPSKGEVRIFWNNSFRKKIRIWLFLIQFN